MNEEITACENLEASAPGKSAQIAAQDLQSAQPAGEAAPAGEAGALTQPDAQDTQGAQNTQDAPFPAAAEFEEFITRFPNVSAGEIPQSVWDEVSAGKSLAGAYAMYENERLRGEIAALRASKSAKERALPCGASLGGARAGDPFIEGFMEK